jgi:hypothetical protein
MIKVKHGTSQLVSACLEIICTMDLVGRYAGYCMAYLETLTCLVVNLKEMDAGLPKKIRGPVDTATKLLGG